MRSSAFSSQPSRYCSSTPTHSRECLPLLQLCIESITEHFDQYTTGIDEVKLREYKYLLTAFDDHYVPDNVVQMIVESLHAKNKLTSVALVILLSAEMQSLSLSKCSGRITNEVVQQIAKRAPCLSSLDLAGCKRITPPAFISLARSLRIRSKERRDKQKGDQTDVSDTAIGVMGGLRMLDLSGCSVGVTDEVIEELSSEGAVLQQLLLSDLPKITDRAVRSLGMHLGISLETLDLGGCTLITDASVRPLLQQCRCLRRLSLAGCWDITDASFDPLLSTQLGTEPLLSELDVSVCSIGDRTIHILRQVCGGLRKLNIGGCKAITDKAFTDETLFNETAGDKPVSDKEKTKRPILRYAFSEKLVHLEASGCTNVTSRGINALIHYCHRIQVLHFPETVQDKSLKKAIKLLPSLRILLLDNCTGLTDDAFSPLLRLPKDNKPFACVEKLSCRRCLFGDGILRCLAGISEDSESDTDARDADDNASTEDDDDDLAALIAMAAPTIIKSSPSKPQGPPKRPVKSQVKQARSRSTSEKEHAVPGAPQERPTVPNDAVKALVLRELYLEHTLVTDAGVALLGGLPQLRVLEVRRCKGVRAEGVNTLLAQSESLAQLDLRDCKAVSKRAWQAMQQAHPSVTIQWQ